MRRSKNSPKKEAQGCATKPQRPTYLDCNATTPVDERVKDVVLHYLTEEYANAGSRTHEYGTRCKQAVEHARDQVGAVVNAAREDVIFTSGATESNNLAILGLAPHGEATGRKHIVSTQIEHKSVLEPLGELRERGFDLTLLPPTEGGWIEPECLRRALRPETLLVSMMHVNNETGTIQDISAFSSVLAGHDAFFHVDAAQSYGKLVPGLDDRRIDLISVSAHKLYAPKGVGALITRKRNFSRPPLKPIMHGGGQERGLRPGTLPVALIAGFGHAAELAAREARERRDATVAFRADLLATLRNAGDFEFNGSQERSVPHTLNLSFTGIDSEALLVALKDTLALSNGSACTSQSYAASHVLEAMKLAPERIRSAVRLSWCHLTVRPDWERVVQAIKQLR